MEDRGFNYDATYEDLDYDEKNHCFECGEEIPHGEKYCRECLKEGV